MEKENQPEVIYSWQALEFSRNTQKGGGWYLAVLAVAVLIGGYAIYQQEWIRLAVVIMVAVVIGLVMKMQPKEYGHAITSKGVKVGEKFYEYSRFKAFGVVNAPEGAKLVILPAQKLGQGLSLQLGGANIEKVRTELVKFLPEETREEDLIDRMNRMFGI